jgi:DNA replication protein DnaC
MIRPKRVLGKVDFVRMNLPEAFWRARVSEVPPGIKGAVERYLGRLDDMQSQGVGLLLMGGPGVGKSAVASLILKESRASGRTGFFSTIWELREGIKSRILFDEHTGLLDRAREVDVLVLDKFQLEDATDLVFGARAIEELIAGRNVRHRVTILTTRLLPSEFRTHAKLASLFASVQGVLLPIIIEGENRRQVQHNHLVETILGKSVSRPQGRVI